MGSNFIPAILMGPIMETKSKTNKKQGKTRKKAIVETDEEEREMTNETEPKVVLTRRDRAGLARSACLLQTRRRSKKLLLNLIS